MQMAIQLSRLNVERGTGGPFGAAVFDLTRNQLVGVGVNVTVSSKCSIAHAEILALAFAQKRIGHFSLYDQTGPGYELVTSTEPCAMCLGAIGWSGIQSLVCGACDEDARQIGFQEGIKPLNWVRELEKREIRVMRNVCRADAVGSLVHYREAGGIIYNGKP